jgi:carboxylate-amine ligase
MTHLPFKSISHLTLGVEVEIQLMDQNSLDLYPIALEILKESRTDKIKPEMFQSMVEINTGICKNVHEVKEDILATIRDLNRVCQKLNVKCSAAGTHPFAQYSQRIPFPSKRYDELIDRNQWIARRLSIFGLHVHIGMSSKEDCISFMNFYQHFLPHLIALSASSPFWQGQNTGLASSRLTVFEASPTSGHSPCFHNWDEFEDQYVSLINCGAIHSTKDLWWDIRPSPHFGTLEIRICDGVATKNELLGLLAFIHCLAHWFNGLSPKEKQSHPYGSLLPLWIIRENKWRAIRYGLDMQLIKENSVVSLNEDILNLLKMLKGTFDHLDYNDYWQNVMNMLTDGNSATRQLNCFLKYDNLEAVARMNSNEFEQTYVRHGA